MNLYIILNKQIKNLCLIKNYFKSEISYLEYSGSLSEYYKLIVLAMTNKLNKVLVFTTTGIGEFILSNKISGVRASHILDDFTAKSVVAHNNAQIAVLPLSIIDLEYALFLAEVFLNSIFEKGRHSIRICMLDKIC